MKIECITNQFRDIPSSVYEGLYSFSSETEYVELDVGKQFVVYAITTIKKHVWYLVEVQGLSVPMYYPAHLFKITDGRLSKYWIVKEGQDDYDNKAHIVKIGFKELVEDDFFYGELLEDNPENIEVFKKYKKSMDNEFI